MPPRRRLAAEAGAEEAGAPPEVEAKAEDDRRGITWSTALMGAAVVSIVALGVGLAAPLLELQATEDEDSPRCFVDKEELQAAVEDYTAGGAACREGNSECGVVQTYGWPIGSWCTSNVTDMSWLFRRKDTFDDDLSSWDTSKVTDMKGMFNDASAFNGDVSNWDTSRVTSMMYMFFLASSFNGGVSNWDTSRVTSMWKMFKDATSFNQDVSRWDVASVTDMESMFEEASSFSQNLCVWGAHYSTEKYGDMFYGTNCPNQDDPAGTDTNWCVATCDSELQTDLLHEFEDLSTRARAEV